MLIGDRYGRLTVVYLDGPNTICRCDCGNEVSVRRKSLTSGHTRSCGCLKKMNIFKPDDRFGMLTVLATEEDGNVFCRCDCGKEVSVRRSSLTSGHTKSCGCQQIKNSYNPGDRFGMLTVLDTGKDGKVLCRCDCGNEVSISRYSLSSGNSKSCGCQRGRKKSALI